MVLAPKIVSALHNRATHRVVTQHLQQRNFALKGMIQSSTKVADDTFLRSSLVYHHAFFRKKNG